MLLLLPRFASRRFRGLGLTPGGPFAGHPLTSQTQRIVFRYILPTRCARPAGRTRRSSPTCVECPCRALYLGERYVKAQAPLSRGHLRRHHGPDRCTGHAPPLAQQRHPPWVGPCSHAQCMAAQHSPSRAGAQTMPEQPTGSEAQPPIVATTAEDTRGSAPRC